MPDKEFKTYRQLLTILRGRGMTIGKGSQGSRVMRILEKENYYNVINGYKDLFLDPASTPTAELYKAGTTFDEVYALWCLAGQSRSQWGDGSSQGLHESRDNQHRPPRRSHPIHRQPDTHPK